jgi:predicted NACHT family NTPase
MKVLCLLWTTLLPRIVLLDGLDEIVRPDDRRNVVKRLEDFVRRYDGVPNRFVITSRRTGYDESPLSKLFAHYTLQELSQTHRR